MKRTAAVAICILLPTSACTISDHEYEPTIDAGAGHIVFNPSAVNVNEGGNVELHVHLESPSTYPAEVACTTSDPRLMVHPPALLFIEDRPAEQALLLDSFQDPDAINETLMLICSSPTFDDGIALVDVFDDDELAIVPMPDGSPPVTVAEAQATIVTVRLAARPMYNLVVDVGRAGSKISVSPWQIVFTPENYNVPRNVTVTGVHDADNITDADTLVLSSNILNTVSVPFSVTDID